MGTNCAGYLANVYLYAYELQFIRQLATACTATDSNSDSLAVRTTQLINARKILTAFTFTMRYIDDVHATNNPFFRHLTYRTILRHTKDFTVYTRTA